MSSILPDVATSSQVSGSHSPTVKRLLNRALALPDIGTRGFTHPSQGHFLMLPPEFDVLLAEAPKHVAQVVLEVFRQTLGYAGNGPDGRREWARVSSRHIARKGLMQQPDASVALRQAVEAGYLRRRPCKNSWEYAIHWKSCDTCPKV
jgi:hypothetical protein